jgi:6-pyruvoyl-tetrahydropterin synthase
MDFGGLNKLNDWLYQQWDHRLLISSDDPLLQDFKILEDKDGCKLNVMDIDKGWGPSIEASCKFVFDYADNWIKQLTSNRVWISKIQIWEHDKNSAILSIE